LCVSEVKDSSTLPLEVLREMLKALAEAKGSFGADEKYASSFLASLLGDSSGYEEEEAPLGTFESRYKSTSVQATKVPTHLTMFFSLPSFPSPTAWWVLL